MSDELEETDSSSESDFEAEAEPTPEPEPALEFVEEAAPESVEVVEIEISPDSAEDFVPEPDAVPDFTEEIVPEPHSDEPEPAPDLIETILETIDEVAPEPELVDELIEEEAVIEIIQEDTAEQPPLDSPVVEPTQQYTPPEDTPEIAEGVLDKAATDLIAAKLSETIAGILSNSIGDITKTLVDKLETSGSIMSAPENEAPAPADAIFSVPYTRSPNFVGRFSALSQLFGMWKPGENGRIGVVGLGGIG